MLFKYLEDIKFTDINITDTQFAFLRKKFKKLLKLYMFQKLRIAWNVNIVLELMMIFISYINLNGNQHHPTKEKLL